MENGTFMAGPGLAVGRSARVRVSAVIAAVALVFAMFVMVQQRADAAPAGAAVAASVASVGSSAPAQINFGQIICPILINIRNAFANSPFFSFVQAALNPIIVAFGCSPS
jgi:hypothetical protein